MNLSRSTYYAVSVALAVLMVLTLAAYFVDLGVFNIELTDEEVAFIESVAG